METEIILSYPSVLKDDVECTTKVKILWTGGLDSTFRMIELSRKKVVIQPFYLRDKRRSEKQELEAISLIRKDIENHPETKCKIMPLILKKVSELEPDEEISTAYQRLYKETKLGSQFDWLARFANSDPGLELSLEKSEWSRSYNCISNFGRVKLVDKGILSYYIIDKEHSSDDLVKVFGNFHFPYQLFHITKLDEIKITKKMGYGSTVNKTWFCHSPINNKPCGLCNPCKSAVEEGLSFRLPPSAVRRYRLLKKYGEESFIAKLARLRLKFQYQNLKNHLLYN